MSFSGKNWEKTKTSSNPFYQENELKVDKATKVLDEEVSISTKKLDNKVHTSNIINDKD